jgi:hypothetical protein
LVVGVGQPASSTAFGSSDTLCAALPARPLASAANGVGHPRKIKSLPDVRAAEARSAQIARPEGVTRVFHVSRYKIDPFESTRNLLSKDDWRAALVNEPEPDGPEVSFIVKAFLLSCGAEGLARATARPDGAVVGPSGAAQGVAPDADPGEEVTLVETKKVIRLNFRDTALINFTFRQVSCRDQVPEPLRGVWVYLIVVYCHFILSAHESTPSFDHSTA